MKARSPRWPTWTVYAALGCALLGCTDPFSTRQEEYGPRASIERLRQIQSLDPAANRAEEAPPPSVRAQRPNLFDSAAERVDVTIEQCRAWTLENNLDLKVALIDPDIAATAITEEEAVFESAFIGRIGFSEADRARGLVFPDNTPDPFDFDAGVRVPLRTGGYANIRVPIERNETFGQFDEDNRWSTDAELSLSLPLLRNAGRWTNSYSIRLAALESDVVQSRTKLEVIRSIAAVDRAYWLVYEAKSLLTVRQEQLEQALKQLQQAEDRFRGNVAPRIDVVRAEAGVSRRLTSIIEAELLVKDRQRDLKRLINRPGLDVDSAALLVPASAPDPVRYRFSAPELIEAALGRRMEMLELELRLAQDASTIDFERNQQLPLFTLDYVYRFDGYGDGFDSSAQRLVRVESDGWRVGLNAEVPLGNEAAKARVHRAILTRLQRLATRSAREQSIKQEVLAALDNLEASWQRIMAARQNTAAEAANYRAEQGQYQIGLRNSTEVLDAEARLSDARAEEISAVVDYQVAQIDLAFATGMLLGATRVSW